jgi:4-hydroxy-tetrahydrodipicolinate synthase
MGLEIPVENLKGAYTALITPMHANGKIDYNKLDMLIEDQIRAGITGILACGTTGQSASFKHDEQVDLTKHVADRINARVQLIANAGSNNIDEAIKLAKSAEDKLGKSLTFLTATGYYNKPGPLGQFMFYEKLADSLGPASNLILYNVPGRTNTNLDNKVIIELAQKDNIVGIKEASGDLEKVKAIKEGIGFNQFKILSGEDNLVYDIMELGGSGVISATANVAPLLFSKIYHLYIEGNHEDSKKTQEFVNPLVKAVFYRTNPIPLAHIFDTDVRLPLTRLDGKTKLSFDEDINQYINKIIQKYPAMETGLELQKYRSVNSSHMHYF